MNRAEKISAGAVLFLMVLAGLLLLIQHISVSVARLRAPETPQAQAAETDALHRRGQSSASRAAPFQLFGARELIIPVRGVHRDALADTWGAARAQGRSHQGIDIMAPQGTPVMAARDGRIVRFFESARGGITIYQFDAAENYVFYYAHLLRRAPSLREGDIVRQGQVIGFVGSTGNATAPHLHFEIERLGADKLWYRADAVNPYPYLLNGEAPR